jgi:hypothetical protein
MKAIKSFIVQAQNSLEGLKGKKVNWSTGDLVVIRLFKLLCVTSYLYLSAKTLKWLG